MQPLTNTAKNQWIVNLNFINAKVQDLVLNMDIVKELAVAQQETNGLLKVLEVITIVETLVDQNQQFGVTQLEVEQLKTVNQNIKYVTHIGGNLTHVESTNQNTIQ